MIVSYGYNWIDELRAKAAAEVSNEWVRVSPGACGGRKVGHEAGRTTAPGGDYRSGSMVLDIEPLQRAIRLSLP